MYLTAPFVFDALPVFCPRRDLSTWSRLGRAGGCLCTRSYIKSSDAAKEFVLVNCEH